MIFGTMSTGQETVMEEKFEKYGISDKKRLFFMRKEHLKNILKKYEKMLDFSGLRVIILVFCLSRRNSSIGRATDL